MEVFFSFADHGTDSDDDASVEDSILNIGIEL